MSKAIITFKLMPESPDTDLEPIKEKALEIAKENGSIGEMQAKEEPIAFGVVALLMDILLPEDKTGGIDEVEKCLKKMLTDLGTLRFF